MSDSSRLTVGEDSAVEAVMNRRIEALEKGVQRWRCLTAAGFLTALGAFGLAVFGLSQLENTYFIGEMALAQMHASPQPMEGDLEGLSAPDVGDASMVVLSPAKGRENTESGMVSLPGETSPSVLTDVLGEPLAATEGGSS
jgi:hypothetical protein